MEGERARERGGLDGGLDGGRKLHLLVGRSLSALGPTTIRGQDLGQKRRTSRRRQPEPAIARNAACEESGAAT
jgi:hypothetical protein